MKKRQSIFIKVTTTHLYAFEDKQINGWDVSQVIDEWFNKFDIEVTHASRDAHQIGASGIVINAQQISEGEEENYARSRKQYIASISEQKQKAIAKREKEYRELFGQLVHWR